MHARYVVDSAVATTARLACQLHTSVAARVLTVSFPQTTHGGSLRFGADGEDDCQRQYQCDNAHHLLMFARWSPGRWC